VGLTLPHPKPEMPKPFNDVMSVLVVGFWGGCFWSRMS
jgi:hypothetical protein